MNHLDTGRLQAFLDDELTARDRASAAEHMLLCEPCRATLDDLKDARAVLQAALEALDSAATAPGLPRASSRRFAGWSLARAAVLVLLAAAAGSAAVPGSPVREWIGQVVTPEPEPEPVTVPAQPIVEPVPVVVAAPAGIALSPAGGAFEVALRDMRGTAIRLRQTRAAEVSVSTSGTEVDPRFNIEIGRLEAAGARGGEVLIELPARLAVARLVVDGRIYAEKVNGELVVRVAGDSTRADIVWP